MSFEQYEKIVELLTEIRDLLKSQSGQSQTKITVVGNRATAGRPPKAAGLNTNDDFTL
jgi:hypothetical protein